MHCNEAKSQLESLTDTDSIREHHDLMHHLSECEVCRDLVQERQLLELLAELPVQQPLPGFEERVLRNLHRTTHSAAPRVHLRWAVAMAASVVVAVLLTLQLDPLNRPGAPADNIQVSVVEVDPQETHMVNVLLSSPRTLDNAQITVELDDNLMLEGYQGIHNLQWQTSLKSGSNRLSLPVQLLQGQSGRLTVIVEHGGASRRFSVLVNAKTQQKLSMV